MHARLTRVQAPPEKLDALVEHFVQRALPALRDLPGYAGSSLAVDSNSGDGQAVTFWDSAESLAASETAANGIRSDTVGAAGGSITAVQRLEVALMEQRTPPSTPAYLRVMRATGDPSRIDDVVQETRDKALPILEGLAGFRAVTVGIDRQSGDTVVTGVWNSPAEREASDAQMAPIRREIFELGGAGQPELCFYEVKHVEFVKVGAPS